jgi:hypothetical protein
VGIVVRQYMMCDERLRREIVFPALRMVLLCSSAGLIPEERQDLR